MTENARSFIASPFVFTSLENAYRFKDGFPPGSFSYMLVTPAPGHAVESVVRDLRRLTGVDVLTAGELGRRSQRYWIFSTGAVSVPKVSTYRPTGCATPMA